VADSRRLFFALWPAPALQDAIATTGQALARARALGGREIPPPRIHLTLLFLGDVAPAAEKRLITAAGRIRARPFDLTLDQAGCFFRSKVFWLGASKVPRKLGELAQELRASMAGVGIQPDRKDLVPHVTCLRDIRHVIRPAPVSPIVWPVREFVLVHSTLGAQPQYHVVSHWPLQTASIRNVKTVQSPGGPE
jgi:2'-5' RNA ligase